MAKKTTKKSPPDAKPKPEGTPKAKPKTAPKAKPKTTLAGTATFTSTGFWLMKSEPESYSIEQLKKDGQTLWTGVRNYQARNFMMTSMKVGDQVLFYHSNAEPSAVVGFAEISKVNQPDLTALDPKSDYYDAKASHDHPIWFCAEVRFKAISKNILPLEKLKSVRGLEKMVLLQKGSRLSVQPVSAQEYKIIQSLSEPSK